MSVSESLPDGRTATLLKLLERHAIEFDKCESLRDLKALSVEIREIRAELDALTPPKVEKPSTSLDEVRQRREERMKKTS